MTVYPQSYLPPKSQPWGRAVDKRLHDIEDTARINGLNVDNNLKQLNSSVDLLGRQQSYLSSLKTYTAQEATFPYTYSSSLTLVKTLSLSFTLDRTATVATYATATGSTSTQQTGYADTWAGAYARCDLDIDGAAIGGGHRFGYTRTNDSPSSWNKFIRIDAYDDVNIDNVATLGPGNHTITAKWYANITSGASGWVQIYPAVLVSSIIN